jgi:sirohydrochlorin cobaltochelatase
MLILIAHGSHNPAWRASVEQVVESLQAEVGADRVRLAYMDCTPPTLMDVAADAVQRGIASVRVLPLFLAAEGHVDRDIRPLIDQLKEAHRSLRVELLVPMGQQPSFRAFLRRLATDPDD